MKRGKNKNTKTITRGCMSAAGRILLLSALSAAVLTGCGKKAASETAEAEAAAVSASVSADQQVQEAVDSEGIPVEQEAVQAEVQEEPEAAAQAAPTAEDGSGDAGLMPMNESIYTLACQDGWFVDTLNKWYSPDMVNCYYNGWKTIGEASYHFDAAGMVDRGWKLIGGQSFYFDNEGVYQPDADPNRLLAFTFDDGPSKGTGELLDLCEETGARITFFLVGSCTENYGDVIPRILSDRCELGNHSTDHTQMIKVSTEECVADFATTDAMIREKGNGAETDVYRFPYGDYTPEQSAAVGKPSIMWSLDSLDWDLQDTELVKQRVLEQVGEGDIILMHDLYDTTIQACRDLFPYLISQGYQLVTVKELAAAKGYTLEPGNSYYSFSNDHIEKGTVIQ